MHAVQENSEKGKYLMAACYFCSVGENILCGRPSIPSQNGRARNAFKVREETESRSPATALMSLPGHVGKHNTMNHFKRIMKVFQCRRRSTSHQWNEVLIIIECFT